MIGVGVIGTGALGHVIASRLAMGEIPSAKLAAIAGRAGSEVRLDRLARQWNCQATTEPLALPSLGATLIVEAAGAHVTRTYAIPLLKSNCDLVIMSTGALAEAEFVSCLKGVASAFSRNVYFPSGSIAGIDGVLSAMEGGVSSVSITTRKHPNGLIGAPFLENLATDLNSLKESLLIFEGNAREAVTAFPSNLNVALTLAMAVGDLDAVKVRLVADPAATHTVHRIELVAESGTMSVEMRNHPSPENPRSSWLAALSAIATIRRIASPLRVG